MLSIQNKNPRDDNITFEETGHKYTLLGYDKNVMSVTTLIKKYHPEFNADKIIGNMIKSHKWSTSKYYGKTPDEIKLEWSTARDEASVAGTHLHKTIELYLNKEEFKNNSPEFKMFLDFWNDFNIKYPNYTLYRTEWIIYDEDIKLAGSIDCVLENEKGELIILDWKRTKELKTYNRYETCFAPFNYLSDCNYSHYILQLNMYKHILTTRYQQKVIDMMLVVLHPDNNTFICTAVDFIDLTKHWHKLDTTI